MTMKVRLQKWANTHEPADNLIYKSGYWDQIIFVRDEIANIFAKTYEEYETIRDNMDVISTHTSKSVLLPVFQIKLADGTTFTMRYNFYNWKVSVNSLCDVETDFTGLFDPNERINSVYCEGFPEEMVYGPYAENKRQFTIELANNYCLFTFLWIFAHQK